MLILLRLTARILHVTPYHYKKHNGDDAHQKYMKVVSRSPVHF